MFTHTYIHIHTYKHMYKDVRCTYLCIDMHNVYLYTFASLCTGGRDDTLQAI